MTGKQVKAIILKANRLGIVVTFPKK